MTDSERIERLEVLVRGLAQQISRLRSEIAELRSAGPLAATAESAPEKAPVTEAAAPWLPESPSTGDILPGEPAAHAAAGQPRPPAEPVGTERRYGTTADRRRRSMLDSRSDLEALVGRYGTVALAALTIIVGIGAFLQWAIERITIGPAMRVGLGLLAAAGVAALGARLRSRGARQYGNTLIGLALAIVHVDAWGAGPQLHVIPSSAALAIAAVASLAVAVLAFREQEQSLFSVGTGGALIAPFVTSDRSGRVVALLVYGLVVLTTGLYALRGRRWEVARTIMMAGGVAYVFAALFSMPSAATAAVRAAPAIFALACAWAALALSGAEHARPLARAYLGALLSALLWDVSGYATGPSERIIPLALLGAATAYVSLRTAGGGGRSRASYADELADGALLPLALLGAALASLEDAFTVQGALVALVWSGLAFAAWTWREPAAESETGAPFLARGRPVHLMTAGAASALAVLLALHEREVLCVVALCAHAALFAAVARQARAVEPAVPAAGALVLASAWAYQLLNERTPYEYVPFATTASLAALAASAGWVWWAWQLLGVTRSGGGVDRAAVALLGSVPTFLWGREELAHALSPDASTFLLIFYYAATGVAAIFLGRRYAASEARKVGLALAVYAALKALAQASELTNIGLRVGSYLLVGGFLLGVAYWYRASNERLTAPQLSP